MRDGLPGMRCDLVDHGANRRLSGVRLENVAGTVEYRTQWQTSGPAERSFLNALAAGTVHAELVLEVRGGGDYTKPDRLEVVAVAVSGGLSSESEGDRPAFSRLR